jgi:hypothetical protein
MILVRDVFQLKFGKAKEALALWKEGKEILQKYGHYPDRVLTDLAGNYYTLVLETTSKNLSEFEESMKNTFKDKAYSEWYQKFIPLAESGHREIFNIVE